MRPSNYVNRDSNVNLTTLGVVTLDTTIVPDVFGLHAFDNRPCTGSTGAAGRILEHGPGVGARCRCHTGGISRRSVGRPIKHTRLSCQAGNLYSLKRCWPSSLFADMHKRQADMVTLRRD